MSGARLLACGALLAGCHRDPCEEPGAICTIAGTGDLGYNGQGLPADETWLFYPSALDFHPDGRLVVVDFNNFLVRALEADGALSTLAGNNVHGWAAEGPALDSPLENAIDVSFDADGRVLLAELHAGRVLRVADGWLSILAGTGEYGYGGDGGLAAEATLAEPSGVVGGADGRVYIADTANHCLRVVDGEGRIDTIAGQIEPGYADGAGAGARFSGPQRLHLDGGSLLIADSLNHAVRRLDLESGEVSTVAGIGVAGDEGDGGPADQAALNTPTGVATDEAGNIYIADSGNHRVRVVSPDGRIAAFAGQGTSGYGGDQGPATEALLNWPADVALGPDGAVYVADMRNGVVRRIAP